MRILFIDDDPMTVDVIIEHLKIQGHDLNYVKDVPEAIELLMWEQYDVIFIDVMLPYDKVFTEEETSKGRYTGLKLLEMIYKNNDLSKAREAKIALITNWRGEPEVDRVARRHN